MVVPVLVGIPWLAGVLGGAFAAIVAWLAKFLTEKIAVKVAIAIFFTASITLLSVGLNTLSNSVTEVFPAEYLGYMGLVLPTGAEISVTTILAAKLLRWVFDWKVKIATMYAG